MASQLGDPLFRAEGRWTVWLGVFYPKEFLPAGDYNLGEIFFGLGNFYSEERRDFP